MDTFHYFLLKVFLGFYNDLYIILVHELVAEFHNNITSMDQEEAIDQCVWYVLRCRRLFDYTEGPSTLNKTYSTDYVT